MKLFYKPGACSLASHITLRESGKDFTLIGVDLMHKRMENGDDFLKVNPKGQVPALLLDDNTKPTARALLDKKLAYIDESLANAQWISGSRFTIADAYLFTVLRWAFAVKLEMAGYKNIAAYMERVAARPAVAAAMAAEGLK